LKTCTTSSTNAQLECHHHHHHHHLLTFFCWVMSSSHSLVITA
jgi:hypothetical protein